jgi:CMP-N,N'-diacetyllegionaminic acid synthase
MRTLAIIPARGGSKRLPGKNIKNLLGKPLIAWTIEFAKSVPWFDEIQVSTDSEEIAAICAEYGVEVSRLRPTKLASDEASSLDVVLDMLSWRRSEGVEFDTVALLQPTTPVRFMQRWTSAYDLLNGVSCDGVISVTQTDTHPYLVVRDIGNGFLEPWDLNSNKVTRSQDFPLAYKINGALYWMKVNALLEQRTFFPNKCRYVEFKDKVESIDIDTLFDWQLAEILIADTI